MRKRLQQPSNDDDAKRKKFLRDHAAAFSPRPTLTLAKSTAM